MRDLSITLVQADQCWEDVSANLSHYEDLLSGLEATDLIVLPEMFQTSFSMNTSLAEKMEGQSVSWLKRMAVEKKSAFYTSLMIEENGTFYNRGVFVRPTGEIEHYDKRKTFGLANEGDFFQSGTKETIVEFKGWNIQLQICYDLRFPEISRNRILQNGRAAYDLLLYVANWPEKRAIHWNSLLSARAIENQSYLVAVNRVGVDGKEFHYSGDSKIINALGEETNLPQQQEAVQTFVIKMEDLQKIREMLPFLCDRS